MTSTAVETTAIDPETPLARLLHAADRDIDAFFDIFTEDAIWRMANNPPVQGIDNIKAWVADYLSEVAATDHVLFEQWTIADRSIVRLEVGYTMKNGAEFTFPAVVYAKTRGDQISEYLIYSDPSRVVEESGRS